MPSFLPENNSTRPTDSAERSLQKVVDLLGGGAGSVVSGGVVAGNPVNQTAKSSTTALSANTSRKKAFIQNSGTNVLFIKEGTACSSSDHGCALPGGGSNDDGRGGVYNVLTTSIITIAGTSPRYNVTEVS